MSNIKGKPDGVSWQEVADLHKLIQRFGRAPKPFASLGEKHNHLKNCYKNYQFNYPFDKLPPYNQAISENLMALLFCMSTLSGTNEKYTKACEDYSDLIKFLDSSQISEIKFKGKEKQNTIAITNAYLVDAITIHLKRRPIPVIRLKPPKKVNSKQLLSRLITKSLANILKLKAEGVTDDFLVHFINTTPLSSLDFDLKLIDFHEMDAALSKEEANLYRSIINERQNQLKISSVEAFRKAYSRAKESKTKPPQT